MIPRYARDDIKRESAGLSSTGNVLSAAAILLFRGTPMQKTVEIPGHGGHIKIEVLGYERPETRDRSDANWLAAACSVVVGEFSCSLKLSLITSDFVLFLSQLEEAVSLMRGTAVFNTLEEGLEFTIHFNSAGWADVRGRAQSQTSLVPERTALSFSFKTDQSFLAKTVRELKGIVRAFPIREAKA